MGKKLLQTASSVVLGVRGSLLFPTATCQELAKRCPTIAGCWVGAEKRGEAVGESVAVASRGCGASGSRAVAMGTFSPVETDMCKRMLYTSFTAWSRFIQACRAS
jgi:hypothetical protein